MQITSNLVSGNTFSSYTGSIYYIINDVTKKLYVGQTTRSLQERFSGHCYTNSCKKLYNSIKCYGKEHFSIHPIKVFSCSSEELLKKQLNKWERYYIKKWNTIEKGYNITEGGEGAMNPNRRKAVCQYDMKGRFIKVFSSVLEASGGSRHSHIPECCNGKRYCAYGFRWSWEGETLPKVSKKQYSKNRKGKAVLQYDKKGNFIAEYKSLKEAALSVGVAENTISAVLSKYAEKQHRKTAGGYIWKWKENNITN